MQFREMHISHDKNNHFSATPTTMFKVGAAVHATGHRQGLMSTKPASDLTCAASQSHPLCHGIHAIDAAACSEELSRCTQRLRQAIFCKSGSA
mmetsp:Transcript_7916/g.12587  ORF Transcript_7916/g.12587 Transcript_7916/m.12587 type:complete len:93 (+) Transcript_7916:193-471(+)